MSSKKKYDFLKFLILTIIIIGIFYLIMLYFHGFPTAENTNKSSTSKNHIVDKSLKNESSFPELTQQESEKLYTTFYCCKQHFIKNEDRTYALRE